MNDSRAERYDAIVAALEARGAPGDAPRAVVDALWDGFGPGLSWVGVYLARPGAVPGGDPADDRHLVLGHRRDTPACSPIGLRGVCGRALTSRRTAIVAEVARLGDAYIACDPRDRSEIVVPLLDEAGAAWAVLDLDSWDVGAFDAGDAAALARVLRAAGLRPPDDAPDAVDEAGAWRPVDVR